MKINRNYVAVKDNEVVLEGGLPKFAPRTLSMDATITRGTGNCPTGWTVVNI